MARSSRRSHQGACARFLAVLATVALIAAAGCGDHDDDDDGNGGGGGGGGGGTSSTSSSTVTSSTTPVASVRYNVFFAVSNNVGRLGALQFDATFLGGAGGNWVGAGAAADCAATDNSALATFNNQTSQDKVSGAIIDVDGLVTPGEMARCVLEADGQVTPQSFSVTVVDAANVNGDPPSTAPRMNVTRVVPQ